jgi:hypothetical protein
MSYKKENFSKCQFNPIAEGNMRQLYPKLEEIFETTEDALIRYVILLYDKKSPLLEDERDFNKRRAVAGDLTFFDYEPEDAESQEMITTAIVNYLQFTNDKTFAAAQAIEYKMWEAITQILTPIKGKSSKEELEAAQKKSLLADEIDRDIKRLDSYAREMSGSDTVLEKKVKRSFSSPESRLK